MLFRERLHYHAAGRSAAPEIPPETVMAAPKTPPLPPVPAASAPAARPAAKSAAASPPAVPATGRLMSLDALRGFDMCWILGLDAVFRGLAKHLQTVAWVPESIKENLLRHVDLQLEHVDWEGLRFYDCIFPLFLFLSGVSMSISVRRRQQQFGTRSAAIHLISRAVIICLLGIIYSGGLRGVTWGTTDFKTGLDGIRLLGVLQRIGIASAAGGLLMLWLNTRGLVIALVAILAGYWALLTQIPVPEVGKGNFAPEMNFANYIDKLYLPGKKYPAGATHDPEGLLSTLPAIGTALLGILSGQWLFSSATPMKKTLGLVLVGALLAAVGIVWHSNPAAWPWFPTFPMIKKIWTSSFVLAAGGFSIIALGLFFGVIDGLGFRKWATPFVWVGANPIALYLMSGMGAFRNVAGRLTGVIPAPWTWLSALVAFLLMLATARFLARRNIHIRI